MCYNKGPRPPRAAPHKKGGPLWHSHTLHTAGSTAPRAPCSMPQRAAAAHSGSLLCAIPRPGTGFCLARWTVQAAAAMPRPCSAQGAPCAHAPGRAALHTVPHAANIPAPLWKKACPAAAQAARRWTPCAETACAVAVRPAAFLCKKRRLHKARQHRKARLFCGRYQVTAAGIARGLRRPCWGVFSGMRRKTKAFTGPRHTGPASVFYNRGPALSARRTQGLRGHIAGKPLNRRQN